MWAVGGGGSDGIAVQPDLGLDLYEGHGKPFAPQGQSGKGIGLPGRIVVVEIVFEERAYPLGDLKVEFEIGGQGRASGCGPVGGEIHLSQ